MQGLPIEVNHLTKRYGKHRGVEDLTFSVEPGEIFGAAAGIFRSRDLSS
jgi:ABC-type multidrug transport system ATPase subunit